MLSRHWMITGQRNKLLIVTAACALTTAAAASAATAAWASGSRATTYGSPCAASSHEQADGWIRS
jgi:hypothetical protein